MTYLVVYTACVASRYSARSINEQYRTLELFILPVSTENIVLTVLLRAASVI